MFDSLAGFLFCSHACGPPEAVQRAVSDQWQRPVFHKGPGDSVWDGLSKTCGNCDSRQIPQRLIGFCHRKDPSCAFSERTNSLQRVYVCDRQTRELVRKGRVNIFISK